MTEEEKEAIERIKYNDIARPLYCGDITICNIEDLQTVLNLVQKQQADLEKKDKLEKEVADDIDKVAVELSELSDNIFIINQAMLLQKIAQDKLGKFYID